MPINLLTESDFRPKPFTEAEGAFRKKAALTSDQFDLLKVEQRRRAFRIIDVNNAQLVQNIRDLLEKSIKDGETFPDFRRRVIALFDTEGIPRPALNRLRLAFMQNTLQAYSDQRRSVFDRPEIVAAFPFRQYLTSNDRRVRETHAALDGKVLPWNDPFWDRFTPPWDYGCRCTFIALTAGQVARSRVVVWTWSGGRLRPISDKRANGFAIDPNPSFGGKSLKLDLSGLDDDLRKAIEP